MATYEQDMTCIGPFSQIALPQVEAVLKNLAIDYRVFVDDERVKAYEQSVKERNPSIHPGTYHELPEVHFINLSFADRERIGNRLEKLGIVTSEQDEPSFEERDYYCPQCKWHATIASICPQHQILMIPYSGLKALEEQKSDRIRRLVWPFIKWLGFLGIVYYLLTAFHLI